MRTIGGVWKNFPPHFCNCFRCEASGVGTSVVMQDDDVSTRTFIAQCTTELVQCLDIKSGSDDLLTFLEFGQNQPVSIPEDYALHLRSLWHCLRLLFDGEDKWRHSII